MAKPLDEHARAISNMLPEDFSDHDAAAAVLRVELMREPVADEVVAALAYAAGITPTRMKLALKAAMATRLKALGLDK